MKPLQYLTLLILFLPLSSIWAQGDSSPRILELQPVLQDQVVIDSLLRWKERVYLHMDRDRVNEGEPLFFKAYVYNEPTHGRFSPSGVLRLELRDSKEALVSVQYHPVRDGVGEGVLRFPKKMEDGTYEVRAYTRWMQNYGEDQFFSRHIRVGETQGEPGSDQAQIADITFHPEGGHLLAGIPNRLIVKQAGSAGAEIEGDIIDDTGRTVMAVQPYSTGYGMAIFTPESGRQYWFRNADGVVADLPGISDRGYSLKVNNLDPDKIRLEVQPGPSMDKVPVVLTGERDGHTYFIHMLEFDGAGPVSLDVSKEGMPVGYMNFSLTGLDDTLWAQRPIWIGNRGNLNIDVEPLDRNFEKGARSEFRIRVTDPEGKPVKTDLSIAVTEVQAEDGMNLLRFMNPVAVGSDLKDERGLRFLQDLRAWSDPAGTNGRQLPLEIRYPVQRSLELHGTAYDLENNLLANTEIQMLASSDSSLVIREAKTDASGIIHLAGLDVVGETQFVFRTKGEEQEHRLVKVIPVRESPKVREDKEEVVKSNTYKKAEKRKKLVEATAAVPWDTTGVIELDEARVAKRREQKQVVPSLYGLRPLPNDVVYQDPERPLSIQNLAQRIPGIRTRVTPEGLPAMWHMRRGGGGILWVVDGQVIRTNDPYLSPLTFLTPNDILRMEFYIEVAQTAMFGVITSPGTGVMVVYTRSGNFLDYNDRKAGGLLFKGYEPGLDFETYLFENTSSRKSRKEPPNTLYWNPRVQTDSNGEAVIRFTSPAEYTRIHLTAETLTRDGLVGSFQATYPE